MIKITTISDFVPEAILAAASPEALGQVLSDVMEGARAFWIKRAGEQLHSSRRDYVNGIQEVEIGKGSASISLVGTFPNMVEEGASGFDMHDTLLGPNVPLAAPGRSGKKVNKDGKFYRAIPMRHNVPNAGSAPMGSAYQGHSAVQDAAALGRKIYAAAKNLKPGARLPEGLAPKLSQNHTTDIYSGMIKQQKKYASATQNQYTTFRMISDSKPEKWQNPGIEAAHIADEVQAYVERIAPEAFLALAGGQ